MKTKLIKLSSVAAIALTFSACTSSMSINKTINKDINNISKPNTIVEENVKLPDITKELKEVTIKKKYIFMDSAKNISLVLRELSEIDGRKYYLHKDQKDILLPATGVRIGSFNDLRKNVEDSLEKTIYISKNAGLKDRLKVIKVRDVKEDQFNLNSVPFEIADRISISDALKRLENLPNFKFNINIKHNDFETEPTSQMFTKSLILFKSNNVMDFLNYIQKKLNVYVDIDYDNKRIDIYKYKQRHFKLHVGNIKLNGEIGADNVKVTTESTESESSTIKQEIRVDLFSTLDESIQKTIEKSKANGFSKSYANLRKQSRTFKVFCDYETMKEITADIEEFNKSYKDVILVDILSFDILIDKSYVYNNNTKFNRTGNRSSSWNGTTDLGKTISDAILTTSKALGNGFSLEAIFDSAQNFGYVANKASQTFEVRNNIPKNSSDSNTERYLKDVTVTPPENEGDTAKTTSVTDVINEKTTYDLTAYMSNGEISIDMVINDGRLKTIETIESGDDKLGNPKTKTKTETFNTFLKNGEVKILSNKQNVESAKKYDSIVPTDYIMASLVGGSIDTGYVYTQSVTLISARKK